MNTVVFCTDVPSEMTEMQCMYVGKGRCYVTLNLS